MADETMNLAIEITANSAGAVPAVQNVNQEFEKMPQTINISQQSLDSFTASIAKTIQQHGLLADSSSKASEGIKKVATTTDEASKVGSEFDSVGGDLARAMSALGVESGAAAGRIGALAGALESLKTAAPAIIGVIAGAVTGIAAFETIKEAISSASDLQTSMTRLGQVVKDQGGNWGVLSQQVQAFTDAQIKSTTFTDTAVINSIERLVASGMSLTDAMTSTRIAEDLAAGTGRSLEEATNSLVEATHNRLMGLEAEGVLTKEQVKNGISYDAVLQEIEQHMGGSAASATQTYAGALSHLGAEWAKLLEDVGTPFIAVLTKVVDGIAPIVSAIDDALMPALNAFSSWSSKNGPEIADAFAHIRDIASNLTTFFVDDMGPAVSDLFHAFGNLGSAAYSADQIASEHHGWDSLNQVIRGIGDTIVYVTGLVSNLVNGIASASRWVSNLPGPIRGLADLTPLGVLDQSGPNAAAYSTSTLPPDDMSAGLAWMQQHNENQARLNAKANTKTNFNPMLGGGVHKNTGDGYITPATAYETSQTKDQTAANQEAAAVAQFLAQMTQGATASEDALANKMKLATTVAEYNADSMALNAQKTTDLKYQIDVLHGAISQESGMQAQYTAEVLKATVAHDTAVAALKRYEIGADGAKKQTLAWKNEHEHLAAAVYNTNSALEDAQKALKTVTDEIAKHTASLAQAKKAYEDLRNAPAEALAEIARKWDVFQTQNQAGYERDLATFRMTDAQKVAYYSSNLAQMASLRDADLAQMQAAQTAYDQAERAGDTQRMAYYLTVMGNIVTADRQAEQLQEEYAKQLTSVEMDELQKRLQFENTAAQKMASFLQTIVVEHKSMADAIKSVYQDIEKWFIDMLAQMLAKALIAMPIFQNILSMLGLGGGGGGGVILPGASGGWGGAPPATGGNNAVQTPPTVGGGTAPIMSSPAVAAMMNSALSPSGGGGSVGSGSYDTSGGGMLPDTGGSNPFGGGSIPFGGGLGSATASGGASGGTQTSSGFNFGAGFGGGAPGIIAGLLGRSGIGGLGMAAFGGSMIGEMLFGGKGYSALGGMLGGLGMAAGGALALGGAFGPALMAMMSQPVGWALIAGAALLGAFGGSLFGNHFNPADEPDISQTDAWGQANADMQGSTQGRPMTANGKQFVMDSQTASATGGLGWNRMFEKFVQQYRGQVSTLPYTLQSAFPELEQLWGGATDKADFNPDGKNGYLDIGSGKRALWTEFWQNVNQYGSQISQLMQSNSPISMYVESVNGSMQSIGSGSQTPGGNSNPFMRQSPGPGMGSNSIASGGGGKSMASLAQRLSQSLAININVRNSSTLADSANLERALRDAFATTLPSSIEDLNAR